MGQQPADRAGRGVHGLACLSANTLVGNRDHSVVSALVRSRAGLVAIAVLCALAVLAATIVWVVARSRGSEAAAGPELSIAVTVAGGGVLDLGDAGVIRISPGGVNRDGVLRARVAEGPPPPDGVFTPLGPALKIELDGATLTSAATVEFPVRAPTATDPDSPFAPTGMFFDEAAQLWVPAVSEYDTGRARLVVQAPHFSWWRPFSWNWDGTRDFLKGLMDGMFGVDVLAEAARPSCRRESEAQARVHSQVTAGNHLLWCLELDAADQLLLRVVNNRRMAIQVQMFPGLELAEQPLQPPSIRYLGPVTEQWLAARSNVRIVVLGPGEGASFRVTSLADQTGVGTAPSAVSYLTDVLDIGINELSWMLGKFGIPAASDKERLYRTLFANGQLVNCISGGLTDKSVVANPGSEAAFGRSLGELVLGCLSQETARQLPELAGDLVTAAAFLGSLVKTGLRQIHGLLAAAEYFVDLVSGRNNYFITLAASVEQPGSTPSTAPKTSAPVTAAPGHDNPSGGDPGTVSPTFVCLGGVPGQPCTQQPETPPPAQQTESSHSVSVDSTADWVGTAIQLHRNEQFRVTYGSGSWTVDYRNFPAVGPEGYSTDADSGIYQGCKILPDVVYGTMLARTGGAPIVVGSGGTFIAQDDGTLELRIHDQDTCLGDNQGAVVVTVTRFGS